MDRQLLVKTSASREFTPANGYNWPGKSRRRDGRPTLTLDYDIPSIHAAEKMFSALINPEEAKVLVFDHDLGHGHMFIWKGKAIQI